MNSPGGADARQVVTNDLQPFSIARARPSCSTACLRNIYTVSQKNKALLLPTRGLSSKHVVNNVHIFFSVCALWPATAMPCVGYVFLAA